MARQRPPVSKHRLFPSHSSVTSREDGNAPAGSEQRSNRNSEAVRVSGRREDNSSVGTRSRGVLFSSILFSSCEVRRLNRAFNSLMLTKRHTRVLQMSRLRRFSLTRDCYLNTNIRN